MSFKTEAKERFTEFVADGAELNDNLAAELVAATSEWLDKPVKNVIVSLESIEEIGISAAEKLVQLQQRFYENSASLVFCCLSKKVENELEEMELLELMNYAPTMSEAWDIVQMEEIERELLDDDHPEFKDDRQDS